MKIAIEHTEWAIDDSIRFKYDHLLFGEMCPILLSEKSSIFKRKDFWQDLLKLPIILISFFWISWLYLIYFGENFDISHDVANLLVNVLIGISILGFFWLVVGVPRYSYRLPY